MGMKGLALVVAFFCTVAVIAAHPGPDRPNGSHTEQQQPRPNDILTTTLDRGELFEGDLKLPSDTVRQFYDLNSLPNNESENCTDSLPAAQYTSQSLGQNLTLWPKGVTRYSFDPSVSISLARTVREAMDEWEESTCLHFVSKDPEETDGSSADYVNFTAINGGGCYSDSVGLKGGQQVVNLGNSECQTCGEIMHLIGHVVGLWHEQSRPDRDNYLHIMAENIKEGRRQDFMKFKGSGEEYKAIDLLYDYESIMHYDLSVFTKCETRSNMCPTFVIRNPKHYAEQGYPILGQREKLSEGDLQKVTSLYNNTEDSNCPPASKKGRLTVYIDRGYNIPFTSDTPDTYIKITAKVVNSDDMTTETVMRTTLIRHNLQHPVWDEVIDMGGQEWMPFFRIEAWDWGFPSHDLISIPEVIVMDRIHMERTHCINPSCQGYIRYTYSFTEDGDECLPNPCQNGGDCTDGISSYTCSCPPAWTGTNCHIRLACYDEPCQNGGTCNEHTNYYFGTSTYTCSCPSDWIGSNCQSRLACSSRPCDHGGTCTNRITNYNAGTSTYTCSCWWKWIGNNCQFSRPCSLKPCANGKCTDHIADYDAGIATYSCACRSGWTGPTCATNG